MLGGEFGRSGNPDSILGDGGGGRGEQREASCQARKLAE